MSLHRVGDMGDGKKSHLVDPNRYATKKTIAQGMLDVALLTANASQLRYVLQVGEQHQFYTLMVTLITLSIALQVLVGLLSLSLNLLRDCRLDREEFARSAEAINYTSLALVFSITTTNVMISAFDVRSVEASDVEMLVQILLTLGVAVLDIQDTSNVYGRLRYGLNYMALSVAFVTVFCNAIWSGFGWDASVNLLPAPPPEP